MGSRPYSGSETGSLSRSTPRSWVKNAASSYCGCGNAVARIHSVDAFSAADQAAYRAALPSGANVELGGRMSSPAPRRS